MQVRQPLRTRDVWLRCGRSIPSKAISPLTSMARKNSSSTLTFLALSKQ